MTSQNSAKIKTNSQGIIYGSSITHEHTYKTSVCHITLGNLLNTLHKKNSSHVIIWCKTKKLMTNCSKILKTSGITYACIHSHMRREKLDTLYRAFTIGTCEVLITSNYDIAHKASLKPRYIIQIVDAPHEKKRMWSTLKHKMHLS